MSSRRASVSLFVCCLVIRLIWLITYPRVIENEGTQYARLAQNLLAHRGYMDMRGPVTMLSPLYSILIGAVSFLTRNTELAGRVISLLAGAMLPVAIFLIAEKIYGRRTALAAGLLTGLLPTLIALSGAVYSEGIYLTLLMAAVYWTLIASKGEDYLAAVYAGVCAGLAYLARPEGLLFAFLFAAWIGAGRWFKRPVGRGYLARAAVLLTTSVVLALPFMIFLTLKTGRFCWEGKSAINDNIVARMETGMSYQEATSGLGPNLREDGVALANDQFAYVEAHPVSLPVQLHLIADGYWSRLLNLLRALRWAGFLGSPFIWILVGAGLVGGPWNRVRLAHEGLLCAMTALSLFILSSMHFIWNRFLFAVLPIALIWTAHGAVSLHEWIHRILERKGLGSKSRKQIIAWALPVSLLLLVLLRAAQGTRDLSEVTEARDVEAKVAGLWITSHFNGTKTLMSAGGVVPYYAGAVVRVLPYADSTTTLAYLHRKDPDFIVLRGDEARQRPYLPSWLQNGIPDACAQLAYRVGDRPDQVILVYEWTCR